VGRGTDGRVGVAVEPQVGPGCAIFGIAAAALRHLLLPCQEASARPACFPACLQTQTRNLRAGLTGRRVAPRSTAP
jgi:hypothetical protein